MICEWNEIERKFHIIVRKCMIFRIRRDVVTKDTFDIIKILRRNRNTVIVILDTHIIWN